MQLWKNGFWGNEKGGYWYKKIFEDSIPVKKEVNALCELLGFDPLYLANEGKLLAFVAREDAKKVWCPPFE